MRSRDRESVFGTELARQFEGKARDALTTLEKLGDTDWKKVTAAEKW